MKLNCGSGFNKLEGFVNIDSEAAVEPDVVWNLECTPWLTASRADSPIIKTSSVDEVVFNHSLEHMGATTEVFKRIIQEVYRVCADGATVTIRVPHWRHDDYASDPTHVRIINIPMMALLSKKACAEFKKRGAANTPLAVYWDVDFEVVSSNYGIDERFQHWINPNGMIDPGLERQMVTNNNVIKEITIALRVVKPAAETPEGEKS